MVKYNIQRTAYFIVDIQVQYEYYIVLSGEEEGAKEKVFCIPLTYISFLFMLLLYLPAISVKERGAERAR